MHGEYDYSIYYKKYHDGSPEDIQRREKLFAGLIFDLIKDYPRSSAVLDYGCGDGGLTSYLGKFFDEVLGVDASAEQVESARRNGVDAKCLHTDDFSAWIESNAGKFDIVFYSMYWSIFLLICK